MKNQKDIFLNGEGDAFFTRNKKDRDMSADPLVKEINYLIEINAIKQNNHKLKILEIGCGDGQRGLYINKKLNCDYYGIDPSTKAVNYCNKNGLKAFVSTADKLPFKNDFFDVIIFGFCLYVCDRKDLKKISSEATRILKNKSWILIMDFFSQTIKSNSYHHFEGVKSYKCDYRKIFDKKLYTCFSHKIIDHDNYCFTDIQENWISISSLRKKNVI